MSQESNCISHFVEDGKPQDQAVAICLNDPDAHLASADRAEIGRKIIESAKLQGVKLIEIDDATFQKRKLITGTAEFFQKDGKNFAKFFLINGAENLKGWKVADGTIERFISTFKGQPFISEPELAHFGADDLPLHQVVQKQEGFRVGNITEVDFNAKLDTATAIVEFENTSTAEKVWNDMQSGEAFYVSPAVAGIADQGPNGPIFTEWFGLHLARVANPAYGVLHATIKGTCSGPEKACISQLLGSATASITSNKSACTVFKQIMATAQIDPKEKQLPDKGKPRTAAEHDDEERKKLEDENASMKKEIAALKTAQEGEPTPEPAAESLPALVEEVKNLKEEIAVKEGEEIAIIVEEIMEIKEELNGPTEEEPKPEPINVEEETAALKKLSLAELKRTAATLRPISASVKKFTADLAGRVGTKIIKTPEEAIPSTASASAGEEKPDYRSSLNQMARRW